MNPVNNASLIKYFGRPLIISVIVLILVLLILGPAAAITATLLALLEVTLSFDNAVVNAKVLNTMSAKWQKRFLTWGIAFAVVGTRLILPILVVSIVAGISPILVSILVVKNPVAYAQLLGNAHYAINAFGTAFLSVVALKYFFDEEKSVHWIERLEQGLSQWGSIEEIEIALVMIMLLIVSYWSDAPSGTILTAGIVGIILYIIMEGLTHTLHSSTKRIAQAGLMGFIYLNVLDSAFSLDGVIGAFAITTNVVVIAIGLGIGAYFVRCMTMYLVHTGTLSALRYLEHGAHWAILGLALNMAASLIIHVPEVVTALTGLIIIAASYISSLKYSSR